MTVSEKEILRSQSAILEKLSEVVEALSNGVPARRYLGIEDAERYCGFEGGDVKHRKFLRFVKDEEIPFKRGNTAAQKIFDVVELNKAMRSRVMRLG